MNLSLNRRSRQEASLGFQPLFGRVPLSVTAVTNLKVSINNASVRFTMTLLLRSDSSKRRESQAGVSCLSHAYAEKISCQGIQAIVY